LGWHEYRHAYASARVCALARATILGTLCKCVVCFPIPYTITVTYYVQKLKNTVKPARISQVFLKIIVFCLPVMFFDAKCHVNKERLKTIVLCRLCLKAVNILQTAKTEEVKHIKKPRFQSKSTEGQKGYSA